MFLYSENLRNDIIDRLNNTQCPILATVKTGEENIKEWYSKDYWLPQGLNWSDPVIVDQNEKYVFIYGYDNANNFYGYNPATGKNEKVLLSTITCLQKLTK